MKRAAHPGHSLRQGWAKTSGRCVGLGLALCNECQAPRAAANFGVVGVLAMVASLAWARLAHTLNS